MKKNIVVLIFVFCNFLFSIPIFAVSYPSPTGYVSDFANLYTAQFKNELENDLSSYAKETGNEIAVVTIISLEGTDIETYAVTLFGKWKIGKKGSDNGLLLLISKEDRKIRIEVGYGLEPYINDARAGDIIRNVIAPEFKRENYKKGTGNAISQIKEYLKGSPIATSANSRKSSEGNFYLVLVVLFIIYSLATYLASYLGRTKEIWPGAVLGGVLGGVGGIIFGTIIAFILGAVIFALLGIFLDFILTKNYKVRKEKGLPTGFWHTWGGFGGGSGGGGFGGFGGGGSGGGGSSGGW